MSSAIRVLEDALQYKEVIADYFFPWKLLLDKLVEIMGKTSFDDLSPLNIDDKMVQLAHNAIINTCFEDAATKGRGVCSNHVYFAVTNFFKKLGKARTEVGSFCKDDLDIKKLSSEVEVINKHFELLRLFSLFDLHLMDCTVEKENTQEDHYSLCFVSCHDTIVNIMDVSLNKSFEAKKTTISNCSTDKKKSKLPELNQMIAMTNGTFHRWNIQLSDKKQELVVSKFVIAEKLTEKTYLTVIDKRKAQWSSGFLKEVFLNNSLKYNSSSGSVNFMANLIDIKQSKNLDKAPPEYTDLVTLIQQNTEVIINIQKSLRRVIPEYK